jgi:hypothetical protein
MGRRCLISGYTNKDILSFSSSVLPAETDVEQPKPHGILPEPPCTFLEPSCILPEPRYVAGIS